MPQFKSIDLQLAELAAYATCHADHKVRQKFESLPPGVQRKILQRVSAGDTDARFICACLGRALRGTRRQARQ